jgi:site-specific DNA-methyltransferase (adenine-specific)
MLKMESYYETEFGELYNTEVQTLIESLQESEEEANLIFADPPYNIDKAEWDKFESQEQYLDWVSNWVSEAGEVLTEDGSMFVMGFSEILAQVKCRLDRNCDWIDSTRWMVWHYRNKPQMSDSGFTRSHESILWLRKSEDYKFRMDRVRIPYNEHTKEYPMRDQGQTSLFGSEEGYTWDPNVEGAKPRDVFDVPTVNNASKERTEHPTQKPEELLRKFVWSTTDKDDLVLDPFGGSGTTYAVAEQLGRNWVGSETSEEYCEMIENRLEGGENLEDPTYWMKHDLDRRQHRRKVRYGSDN